MKRIAISHGVTVQEVRKEIQEAMEAGQRSEDSKVREIWDKIPQKGQELTLEEFLDFLIQRIKQ